jgi:polyvinyl alcohol dehydrogenase (cytochrome)
MFKFGVLAAIAACAICAGSSATAQEHPSSPAQREPWNPEPDLTVGAKVYQARCASCHDKPLERAPSKQALSELTAAQVRAVVSEGIMRPMSEGLSVLEVVSVSSYVGQRKAGSAGGVSFEAPLCKQSAPPFTLNGRDWNGWGREVTQPRFQPTPGLKASQLTRLKLKWAMSYAGGRTGQATVVGGRVFFNTSSGAVYSLDARTGCAYWRFDAESTTRSSIAIGALPASDPGSPAKPRYAAYFTDWTRSAYALDAETGALLWKTQVDEQNGVQMTGSPTLHEGVLYVPVSSAEEALAMADDYECCKFRGAVAAVDAIHGKLLWKTYMTPDAPKPFRKNAKGVQMYGPAGAAIWSAPTIDAMRGLVYVATGDSYTDVELPLSDAIVALDLKTGEIRWSQQMTKADNYIIGCYGPKRRANCPTVVGPDYDFGASPILHTLPGGKQLILLGQKSSEVYALDPDARGALVWKHRLSSGGSLGGIEFSIVADTANVYAPVADIFSATKDPKPGLSAFRIADGKHLWTTPSPVLPCHWQTRYCHPALSQAASGIPGAIFAGAMNGRFRAYSTKTGKVLWEYDTGGAEVTTVSGRPARGSVMDGAGPTIARGMVYVTSGYQGRSGTPGQVLMAFSLDGK